MRLVCPDLEMERELYHTKFCILKIKNLHMKLSFPLYTFMKIIRFRVYNSFSHVNFIADALCHFFPNTLICRYEQSELIERELEQMTEQIKSVIQSLNSNQVLVVSCSFILIKEQEILLTMVFLFRVESMIPLME